MSRSPFLLAAAVSLIAGSGFAADDAASWSYTGDTGAERWGQLSAEYQTCATGRQQSPIDLSSANVVARVLVSVDYAEVALTLKDTGKTVQVDFPAGSYLTTSGRVFSLAQVHFHTPSEHTLRGRSFPLTAHFVHASDEGALAVLGVMFEEGAPNTELQKILDAAGSATAEPRQTENVSLQPRALLPEAIEVFRYMGSLTTPPCTEGVHWHVAEDPVTASAAQIQAFEELMGTNARPVLSPNGRLIIAPE